MCENICVETFIQKLFKRPQCNCNITKIVKHKKMFVNPMIEQSLTVFFVLYILIKYKLIILNLLNKFPFNVIGFR